LYRKYRDKAVTQYEFYKYPIKNPNTQ